MTTDPYKVMASRIYAKGVDQVGKVAVLGCGYQMGKDRFPEIQNLRPNREPDLVFFDEVDRLPLKLRPIQRLALEEARALEARCAWPLTPTGRMMRSPEIQNLRPAQRLALEEARSQATRVKYGPAFEQLEGRMKRQRPNGWVACWRP